MKNKIFEFKLPDIGEGVAEGQIDRWLVKEGDVVKEHQPLADLITEKVNVELPCPKNGKISKILHGEGSTIQVGEVVVEIEYYEEDSINENNNSSESVEKEIANNQELKVSDVDDNKIIATPAIRKLAKEMDVDLSNIIGTGEKGRIKEEDLTKYKERSKSNSKEEIIEFTGMRKSIADKLSESVRNIAQATCVEEVDITELISLKNKISKEKNVTLLSFIIKSIVIALEKHPKINSIWNKNGELVLKKYYNIGIATDTSKGLIVPVLKDVNNKNVEKITNEVNKLAERAREGSISLEEIKDGTFTITNIGSIGSILSIPIVNYPQSSILAVNRINKKPAVVNGNLVEKNYVYLTVSFDHRILDGADVARFLNTIKELIEKPDGERYN